MRHFIEKRKMTIFIFFNLLLTMGMNLGHPVTPSLIKSLDLGDHVFGIAFAAMSTMNFLFALIWSNLANGLKKTRILMVSSIGYAIAQLLFAFSTSEASLYIARFLGGAFAGGFQVGLMTYIINEAPEDLQARYITMSSVIVSIGAALGFFIGGKLGDISVLLTFYIQAALHIVLGLLFYFVLGRYEKIDEHLDKEMIKGANPFKVLSSGKEYFLGLTSCLFASILISSIGVTLFDQSFNYYIKDVFDFPPSVNGNIKALVGIFALVLNSFVMKRRAGLRGETEAKVLPFVSLLMAVLAIVVRKTETASLFMRFSLAWFALNTMLIPLQQNLVMSYKTDVESGNQLSGLYNALLMLGKIFGALGSSFVYSYLPEASFSVSGVLLILSFVLVILQSRKRETAA